MLSKQTVSDFQNQLRFSAGDCRVSICLKTDCAKMWFPVFFRFAAVRIRFALFCVCLVHLLWAKAQRQHVYFTSLTTKEGLSSNTVNTVIKDRYGLIWFGTEDGLDRFDGINFTTYRYQPGKAGSLRANEILSLFEDRSGNLWVGTSGGSLSLYNRRQDAFTHIPANGGRNALRNNVVRGVCNDKLGRLWVAHFDGVDILNPKTGQVSPFPLPARSSAAAPPLAGLCVFEDSRGQIWMGTTEGLFCYNLTTNSLTRFVHSATNRASLAGNNVNAVAEDGRGNVWIGTDQGLSKLAPGATAFVNYHHDDNNAKTLSHNFINSVAVDGESLWLGTSEGLDVFDTQTAEATRFRLDDRNSQSLTAKAVRTVYIDREGIYWLGTIRGGVDKYDRNLNLFNYVQSNAFDKKGLNASVVTSFAEDKNGDVFIGTDGGGLNLYNRKTRLFAHFPVRSRRTNPDNRLSVLCMKMSRQQKLIMGTYGDGLFQFDPASGKSQQLMKGPGAEDLNSNEIFCLTEDSNGNIWVGTNGDGINVLSPQLKVTRKYTPHPKFNNDVRLPINGYIRDIEEDREGNFWIATHGGGIAMLRPASDSFAVYNTQNSKLPNDKVFSLLEDGRGNLLVGTKGGGLSVFDKGTKQFTTYSEKDGLQNTTIYKVLEDANGLIWVSTNKGISSLDLRTKKIANYNYHNGVQNNNFVHESGLRLSDGVLFFGGLEGFNYFNPAALKRNSNLPKVIITDLRISNRSVSPSGDGPIEENIATAREIHLDYKQNFALSFVSLNYTAPEQNQYAYKLEGFDRDWNHIGNANTASYTNLDPGEYRFRVKASNNDGVWNTEGASVKIYVHPPWWRTVYAYVLYALALVGALLYVRHRGIQRLKRKFALEKERARLQQERKEAERLHELDRLKIKFLTNLSHEFRTPISLILGPVEGLLSQIKSEQPNGQLQMIKRNGRRLLNLVNQLLDFRKMEEHELKLHESEGELVAFVKEVSDSFKDLSERKKIAFAVSSEIEHLHTRFDHDKLERILFNLLSNAFKFTLEGGRVRLALEKAEDASTPQRSWVNITVSDTGIGIPEDKKEKIFDRFFQHTTAASVLNQGTGIGLSITREFVKMHGGTIAVESEVGKGTTLSIRIPFAKVEQASKSTVAPTEPTDSVAITEEAEFGETTNGPAVENGPNLQSVLLVEDNDDFRFYLKDNLRLQYKVFEAANGKEGWQKALAEHPQLIVSDINMPYMDGIALCRKIKADKRTAHIPVILLTALAGEEDQLRGLETGANDYITKPFNFEVLNAKVKNLLHLNRSLKDTYTKQIKVLSPEIAVESADEKLLQNVMRYVEENLTDTQLSVENLSRHVGMSRSSLYNKLLQLTGQTPVEFIRSVKLDKAAALLEKSDLTIAQIAYSVGFSTPNYFSKSFKEKFNVLPSEYRNR